jgi:hypothetical protein
MKEIDFLPEWYKNSRRQQISYRTQYFILGCIFAAIMLWNFIAARSISKAAAELTQTAPKQADAESILHESVGIKSQAAQLQEKAGVLEKINSKINVSDVLAEISFLVDERIVLSKVELKAEKLADKKDRKLSSDALLPAGGENQQSWGGKDSPLGNVRFKVTIKGIALNASDVAELICRLEDSPYFCQAVPSFSRNIKIKTGADAANRQVSEFEISCYLANYQMN